MRVFILDDDPGRHHQFRLHYMRDEITTAYTAQEAIAKLMAASAFDIVQLDHDLGGEQMVESGCGTGYEVARAVAEMAGVKKHGRVIVHSYNPKGALAMMKCLVEKGMCVEYRPFGVWTP